MSLSEQELKALYDKYEAAGKFDYLKSIRFADENLYVRTKNVMKTYDFTSLYQLTNQSAGQLIKMRNAGWKTFWDLDELISSHHGFIFNSVQNNSSKPADIRNQVSKYPTFKKLVETGQLDSYLAKGEELADQRDPEWRKRVGLPLKEAIQSIKNNPNIREPRIVSDPSKSPAELEADHREQFINHYIGTTLRADNRVEEFLLPLVDVEKIHSLGQKNVVTFMNSLPERENRNGAKKILTLGDLAVRNDDDLVQSFGFSKNEMVLLHKGLDAYGLKNGMRDTGSQRYDEFVAGMIEQAEKYGKTAPAIAARQKEDRQQYGL